MTDTTITSTFYEKIASACRKKEALFDENLGRYALRSMFAGAYLTMSTAVGVVAADVISQFSLAFGRFAFAFIFSFGLVYVLLFNGELATSNMMFLSSGTYYKHISFKKTITILLTCTFFNLIGAIILAWLFNQSFSFAQLTHKSFLVNAVQTKLAKSDWQNFFEGITANMFVNIAILGYMLLKEESAKITIALSAIFMKDLNFSMLSVNGLLFSSVTGLVAASLSVWLMLGLIRLKRRIKNNNLLNKPVGIIT